MENKLLQEYEEKLSKLTEEESKERDIYLHRLATGKIQGPNTGYPSIDKPWLKYQTEEAINKDFDAMSAYQLMYKNNVGHERETAITYFGNKISYQKLFDNINLVAIGLKELSLKKGDTIMMCMPNTPEAEYLFYAANKLGIVVSCIDPRSSVDEIIKDAVSVGAKYCFGIDVMYDKFKQLPMEFGIVNISPFTSLPLGLKQVALLKNKSPKTDSRTLSWSEFIKYAKKSRIKDTVTVFEPNTIASIVHTGGTTGKPKGVMLSNEDMNGLMYQMIYGYDEEFHRGQRFLNFLPPFIALGLNNATHLSACFGLNSIMIPSFEPEEMPDLILKHKPNIFLCGPTHLSLIMKNENMQKADLSFLEVICSGGEKLPLKLQQDFQEFLKNHNAPANAWIGYGATETSAGIACMKNNCFAYESVGIPYLKNNVAVYDMETNEEIYGYNKKGELRISAPTIMMGYTGEHANETDDVIKEDQFGTKWYHTGDIGHINEDGLIYVDGRIKRVIMRKVFKIYPQAIESIILSHPAVKEAAVVGVPDEDEYSIPVANIVLKPEYIDDVSIKSDIKEFVDKEVAKEMPSYAFLAGYNFIDQMPLTGIGKLDFKKLEEMGILEGKKKILTKNKMM